MHTVKYVDFDSRNKHYDKILEHKIVKKTKK